MPEIEDVLADLRHRGLHRKLRVVAGPQGPHVLLDGRPVLVLCSSNYLGLADHPRVREAVAEAAMRHGAGAGASRLVSGNMTVHRRLEERLAEFFGSPAAVLFGSGYLASLGIVQALAGRGDVVFSDELNHASIADGCRLSGAELFVYEHGDMEHLEWGLREADGRGSLIVTEGVFALDGRLAPLPEIVELAKRHDARVLVDESHAAGTVGPAGRGSVAAAGLESEVDVVVGTLGTTLGSYGGYVCCDRPLARYLVHRARTLILSTALAPPSAAGAMAALEVLAEQPERVDKLRRNAGLLRNALAAEGVETGSWETPIVALELGDPGATLRAADEALERGVFVEAVRPPAVPAAGSRIRVSVLASHTRSELRLAAKVLAAAVRPSLVRLRLADDPDDLEFDRFAEAA